MNVCRKRVAQPCALASVVFLSLTCCRGARNGGHTGAQEQPASATGAARDETRLIFITGQIRALLDLYQDDRDAQTPLYWKPLLEYLAEHGTEDCLPVLEEWMAVERLPRALKGTSGDLDGLVRYQAANVTRAWYRIKTRRATGHEKGKVLLDTLRPDRKVTVNPQHMPIDEYREFLPIVRAAFYDHLCDRNAVMPLEGARHYSFRRTASRIGEIIAATPRLHPTAEEEAEILANDLTLGQEALIDFLIEAGKDSNIHGLLAKRLRETDNYWLKRNVLKQMRHLEHDWDDVTEAVILVGKDFLAKPRTEKVGGVLCDVVYCLKVTSPQARRFLEMMVDELADLSEGYDGTLSHAVLCAKSKLEAWRKWKARESPEEQ